MTIAAQLPKSNLDIKGDRLRFLLAAAINECEQQYRLGAVDKSTNTVALLNAALAKLTPLAAVGSIALAAIYGDNTVTAAEAASPAAVAITTTNFADGAALTVTVDGATTAGFSATAVASNAATLNITSAAALALSVGAHTVVISGTDSAGIVRTLTRTLTRTA